MTHDEILTSATKHQNATICDYISIAMANGWDKLQITQELNEHMILMTGCNSWSRITSLIDEYVTEYGKGREESVDYNEYPQGGNPKFISQKRPIIYRGKEYKSVVECARANGKSRGAVRYALQKGLATYV